MKDFEKFTTFYVNVSKNKILRNVAPLNSRNEHNCKNIILFTMKTQLSNIIQCISRISGINCHQTYVYSKRTYIFTKIKKIKKVSVRGLWISSLLLMSGYYKRITLLPWLPCPEVIRLSGPLRAVLILCFLSLPVHIHQAYILCRGFASVYSACF